MAKVGFCHHQVEAKNASYDSKQFKRAVSQAVAKKAKEKQKTVEVGAAEEEKLCSYHLSLVHGTTTAATTPTCNACATIALSPAPAAERPPAPTLQSILARAKLS